MKSRIFRACLLIAAASAFAAEPSPPSASLEPPPGWTDITAKTPVKGVLLALRGPELNSFAVARVPAAGAAGRAAVGG